MRFGWSVSAYVLMKNHFHLVIQTPEPNLSRGMQWMNGTYAGWFNHRHNRHGHLFQGRFHAFLIEKEAYFAEVLRYVVLNPVRAKIVERPEDYPWSSYRATGALESAPPWLDVSAALACIAPDQPMAREQYRDFVLAKIDCTDRLWDKVTNAIYLGTDEWTRCIRKVVESKPRSTDHPLVQRAVGRPKMHAIVQTVSNIARLPRDVVRSVAGGQWRSLIAWIGWYEGLTTLRSIAAALRLRSEGHVSNLIRRCNREFEHDSSLLASLDKAVALLRA